MKVLRLTLWAVGLLVLLIALLLRGRKPAEKRTRKRLQQSPKKRSRKDDSPPPSPYRAVAIRPGKNACDAVKAMREKRFLLNEAPHLPLEGCTSAHCDCRYRRYEDRRGFDTDRRAHTSALATTLYDESGKPERREGEQKRGRRAEDLED